MKPRRTVRSNIVFSLPGGTEDNDLWAEVRVVDASRAVFSTWELTDDERAAIAAGACIELGVWSDPPPPVSLAVVEDVQLGRRPR